MSASLFSRPKILCVDDDVNVLQGIRFHVRKRYDLITATHGLEALEVLGRVGEVAVVMSDMRMPKMDGAALLTQVRIRHPETVRMLLTGHSDLDAAIAAVNDGQVFRFLTKPCAPAQLVTALDAAVEQNRLVHSERVLLEQTLQGSIRMLTDMLAMSHPIAFGRATRLRATVRDLCKALELEHPWQFEVAAVFSQLGTITLPEAVLQKIHQGQPMTLEEERLVDGIPDVNDQLLSHVPRLEIVRGILRAVRHPYRAFDPSRADPRRLAIDQGGQLLRAAIDFDIYEAQGVNPVVAVDLMRMKTSLYDPRLIDALGQLKASGNGTVRELPVSALQPGMVCAEDVMLTAGALLVARGFEVSASFIERARHFTPGAVREPIYVLIPRPEGQEEMPEIVSPQLFPRKEVRTLAVG